jgi:hypothetical protein
MDLIHPHTRKSLAAQIKADIDEYCRVTYDDGFRSHLGASLIGNECSRSLWYTFRWVQAAAFSGRMQRLFNRGHEMEPRFITWLRGIGFEVWEVDTGTGKQFRIMACSGHFGGSLDGILRLPERYKVTDPMLLEMKTKGTGRGFEDLKERGVKLNNPTHFAQMSSYGKQYGFKYALYLAINKNDDDLHVEVVELDWELAADLVRKAEDVILSKTPPPRINESPAYHVCKRCDHAQVCHGGAPYEPNCRSCNFAQPVADGQWFCGKWNNVIPEDFLIKGCPEWHPVGRQ